MENEEDWAVVKLMNTEYIEEPYQFERKLNSSYSVEYINTGAVPWLIVSGTKIFAGTELKDFLKIMKEKGDINNVFITAQFFYR